MDINKIYRNKSKFVVREVGNELILVPLTGNIAKMNEMFTMNETGKFIWENIEENTTVENLVEKLVSEFQVDESIARADTEKFIQQVSSQLIK